MASHDAPRSAYRVRVGDGKRRTELAKLLIGARHRRGWTQSEASERSGVPTRTIARWEAESDARPDAALLVDLLDALDVPRESGFRALGWLPEDQPDPREELRRLMGEMSDDEREQFLIEVLELEARRRRNSQ